MYITLSHYRFQISAPYVEGHQLSQVEAQALNGLRAENIRNTARRKWGGAIGVLTEQGEEELGELVKAIDERYVFNGQPGPPKKRTLDDIALEVAREELAAELRKNGLTMESEYFELEALQRSQGAAVRTEARTRLSVIQAIAEASLEDLL